MNEAAKQAVAASGETPLDFLLRVMRDPKHDFKDRLDAAKAAAPYAHAKLAAVEHSGNLNVSHEHWLEQLDSGS